MTRSASASKRTANYNSWQFVDKRQPFTGSSLYGETYERGSAPRNGVVGGSWLNAYEREQYERNRERITYIVWSFYTPIAYYVEHTDSPSGTGPGTWYKVGQTFSSCTSKHRNGALRNVGGHMAVLRERRGDNTVECFDCGTTRHFTYVKDAREAYYLHR